jgi:hypothetical protein
MNELNGVLHGKERAARHPRRRAALAAASMIVALTAIAACGSTSSAPPPGSAAGATPSADPGVAHAQQQVAEYEKAATSFPAPGLALDAKQVAAFKGKTILFVPDGLIGPFPAIQQGVQTALGHLGIAVKTCDPNFLPTQVAACFGQAKTDGAVAVITAGLPYSLAANAYQALEAEHIPVMVSTAGPGHPASTSAIAFEPGDVSAALAGTVSADQVIADSGGKASVLFVVRAGWRVTADLTEPVPVMTLDAVRWMADREVSVYAGDIGDRPPVPPIGPMAMHQVALPLLGLLLIDGPDVGALAATCTELGRHDFLFVVAPMAVTGATGLPVNPLAIF